MSKAYPPAKELPDRIEEGILSCVESIRMLQDARKAAEKKDWRKARRLFNRAWSVRY
jgi:hypothetical protein